MKTSTASHPELDKERPRGELLLLLLALPVSLCCIFSSATTAVGFWPERINSNLLSSQQADYTGGSDDSRFFILDSQAGHEAATDIARLQTTPAGDEQGGDTFLPPATPQPKQTPQPETPGGDAPVATPATVNSTPTAAVVSTPTTVATAQIAAQPTPTPAQISIPGPPTATSPALPISTPTPLPSNTPLPMPSNTPLPNDDDGNDDDDNDDDDNDDDAGSAPTSTNTPLPIPTAAPTVAVLLSGRVFEDTNYSGGNGAAFGGGDAGLPNVTVELYDGSTLLTSTTTAATGAYTFSHVPNNRTLIVRVVSVTIGDPDTPPTAGFNNGFARALAEQTYENDGVAGNGGAGALGGNDPLVDDTATAAGTGPGDVNVTVTTAGLDVTGVDFGFAFNLVANTAAAGQGSLQQAIDNANAVVGTDTIVFNITGPPPYTIRPDPALREVVDPVIIDGTTQPGFAGAPLVELDGTNVTGNKAGLTVSAGDSTIRGLVINSFDRGIALTRNDNNIIQGNHIGTNVAGTAGKENLTGIYISNNSSNNQIGGAAPAGQNVIAGNANVNIFINNGSRNNVIIGNYIGIDATGMTALGQNEGVVVRGDANTIGGLTPTERNIIAGHSGGGVIFSNATANIVQGNYIGTDVSGLNRLSNAGGILFLSGARGNQVGGLASGAGNIIAFNNFGGILLDPSAGANNRINGNSIFNNAGLGIDLDNNGVTANDNGGSGGPNSRFNFPIIDNATLIGNDVTATGYARPGAIIEFFVAAPNPSGFGEGRTFLGVYREGAADDTDPAANVFYDLGPVIGQDTASRFRFTFPAGPITAGDELTATATDAAGNTSEFGPSRPVN